MAVKRGRNWEVVDGGLYWNLALPAWFPYPQGKQLPDRELHPTLQSGRQAVWAPLSLPQGFPLCPHSQCTYFCLRLSMYTVLIKKLAFPYYTINASVAEMVWFIFLLPALYLCYQYTKKKEREGGITVLKLEHLFWARCSAEYLFWINLYINPMRRLWLSPFYSWRNWDIHITDLSKVM